MPMHEPRVTDVVGATSVADVSDVTPRRGQRMMEELTCGGPLPR
jgi:hypothetical protein